MSGVYFDDKLFNPSSVISEIERFHLEHTEANAFHQELTELMDMFSAEKAKVNAVEAGISTEAVDANRIKTIAKQILDKIIEYILKFCSGMKKAYNAVTISNIVKRAKYAKQFMDVKVNGKYSNTSMNPSRVYSLDSEYAKTVDAAIAKWASWNESGVKTLPELEYKMHRATYLSFNALIVEASKYPKDDFPKNMGIRDLPKFVSAMGNLCDAFARMQPEDFTNPEYLNTVVAGLNFKPIFMPVRDVKSLCQDLSKVYLTPDEIFGKDSMYLPNEKYVESIYDLQGLSDKLARVAENLKKVKAKVGTSDFQAAFAVDQQAQEIANVLSTITNVVNTHITQIYQLDACYTATAQLAKLFDNEFITDYVKKRGLTGKLSDKLLASTESHRLFERDDAGYFEVQYIDNTASLESLHEQKDTLADTAFTLDQYKERIAMHGIGMRDVAAVESLVPGLLTRNAPVGGYTFEPSNQNAEYALEAITAYSVLSWAALGALIVQIAKKCYTWIEQRLSAHRTKRNLEAVRRFGEKLKERVRGKFQKADPGNVNDALKARREATNNPSTLHKEYVMQENQNDSTAKLFREVFQAQLGMPEAAAVDFARADNLTDLFHVMNRHGITGPAFFRGNLEDSAFRLGGFIVTTIEAMKKRMSSNDDIIRQIDGYIAGNPTQRLTFDNLLGPLQNLGRDVPTGVGSVKHAAQEGRLILEGWARPIDLRGTALLTSPEMLTKYMNGLLSSFREDDALKLMAEYRDRYESLLSRIKIATERYIRSKPPGEQSKELLEYLTGYQKDIEAVISTFNYAIVLHGRVSDYCASLANACTAFMETGK